MFRFLFKTRAKMIEQAIESWLNSLAHNSQRNYGSVLAEWRAYLGTTPLWEAKVFHAKGYLAQCSKRPGVSGNKVSHGTLARKGLILKGLYAILVPDGLCPQNPWDKIDLSAKQEGTRRPHRAITPEEVTLLLSKPSSIRDRCFLTLLFALGLRISESLAVTIGQVEIGARNATICLRNTKNGTSPTCQIPDWAIPAIRDRLNSLAHSPPDSPLLGRWSVETARRAFKRYAREAGLGHLTPHSARATAITTLLDLGLSHREVKEFSRHSSVAMVEAYDKKRFTEENHPAKKLKYS